MLLSALKDSKQQAKVYFCQMSCHLYRFIQKDFRIICN